MKAFTLLLCALALVSCDSFTPAIVGSSDGGITITLTPKPQPAPPPTDASGKAVVNVRP